MPNAFSRRNFLHYAGASALACSGAAKLNAQQPPTPTLPLPPAPIIPTGHPSTVSLVRGEDRRKTIYEALVGIDHELRPRLNRKKYVLIKPNLTSPTIQLASTHPDAILGILDYLAPRFKGPVMIAEAASGDTMAAYENFNYNQIVSEFRSHKLSLVDFNLDGRYIAFPVIDSNVHVAQVRIAARLVDPDAFIICAAIPKTHESMVMTGAVKNMVMGSALHSPPKATPAWTDKRKFHVRGYQQHNYNLLLGAQKLAPYWGAAVLDGFEGMEGAGPIRGTAVPARIAIASTDYVAADRVGVETMGIEPKWIGYLQYCGEVGIGNYDMAKIDVQGETIASIKKNYQMSPNIDRELQWMGPLSPDPSPEQPRRNG